MTQPLAKDLAQAKTLIASGISEDEIKLTVAHLLKVDSAYWNLKRRIDPAAIVQNLPIAKKATKAELATTDFSYMHDPARYFRDPRAKAETQ